MSQQEKNLLAILKNAVYGILILTPLLVWASLIFPYITSKTLFFRGVIDLILPFYVFLIIKYPKWRPRKSWLLYSFLIFTGVSLVSSVFGINFLKSFFGDLERMWGVFTLIHVAVFLLILTSIFKEEKDWQKLFKISIIVADIVGVYGLMQKWGVGFIIRSGIARIESTLGNAAFVSGYFLLILGITVYLSYKYFLEKRKINYFYIVSLVIQFLAFVFAGIRGGYLALMISLVLALPALIIYQKNKKLKIAFLIFFMIFAGVYGYIFLNRHKSWVVESSYYSRFVTLLSFKTHSVQTRFISWRAGLTGFAKTPILGIGMENYGYYFDQSIPVEFYSLSKSETWFDRAHNALVEVLVASGLIGLISYLAIFYFLIHYLIKIYQRDKEKNFLMVLIFFFIILSYFIQNFFVFDTLAVFLVFGLVLGYINNFYHQGKAEENKKQTPNKALAYGLVIICAVFTVYSLVINFRIVRIAKMNAEFQYDILKKKDYAGGLVLAEKIFAIDSSLDYFNNKSAALMADVLTGNLTASTGDNYMASLNLALNKLEKDVARYPGEVYTLVSLGRAYNVLANFTDNSTVKKQYLDQALTFLEKAKILSPGRLQVYYLIAQTKMLANDFPAAKAVLEETIKLAPDLSDNYWFMGITYFNFNEISEGLRYINLALDRNQSVNNIDQALQIVGLAAQNKDYQTATRIYEIIITLDPTKPEYYANLATTYALLGDKEQAIKNARKAGELDPSFQAEAEMFIKQVTDGTFKLSGG